MNRISFLKKLDGVVGPFLSRLFPVTSSVGSLLRDVQRILIIRPGGIGDAVLLVPTILALKKAWPQADIDVLAEKRNVGVFALCPHLAQVYVYDSFCDWPKFCFKKYDLIVDTEQWHYLSALIARLIRAHWRCGFATNSRKRLFSHVVCYSHRDYEAHSFFHLLDVLNVPHPASPEIPYLEVSPEDRHVVDEFLTQVSQPFVTLFPGASIPERRWPVERFRQIANFCREEGYGVVVVGGHQDRQAASRVLSDGAGLNLAGELTLAQSTAVLARSDLLLSGDSGVLHLAVGIGCKTVSLFGPGIAKKWAPTGQGHNVVNLQLPCSPCTRFGTTPSCPDQAKCIQGITVDMVKDEVVSLLIRG
ncbi:glycosyltransferase family 9 protein [uncultured Desulfuromonas sp.]|uniref:glycosyltransferase family 9 protein n=1 Tax=uncultured Desulfuromonas sp. TaxID=181013 RepID=UPI002AAB2E01|nr:glycosyltransferase family 9 protein [uncultured Desulfuromonas sp.]